MGKQKKSDETTRSFPVRMERQTYEQLQELASRTGLTMGAAVQRLLAHGGDLVFLWESLSTGMLGNDPGIEEETQAVLQEASGVRRKMKEVVPKLQHSVQARHSKRSRKITE
ncbi:hypothetical protein ACFL6M_02435 [Candidatus Eisenbacteria bacterium]|uniref:Ribbon-helix-helix protein CopG domain-containing protein n=1 Tax=Eiseniibacteriota bacterium TaxID=2212470 RepID=A0ABV6YJT6_UNCEI